MMEKELNLLDVIKPIWSERYSILLHLTLFVMIVVSLFSVVAYVIFVLYSYFLCIRQQIVSIYLGDIKQILIRVPSSQTP